MLSPLLADIPSNAVLFGIYEFVLRSICQNHKDNKPHLLECKYSTSKLGFVAGGVAGIGYAIVVCPAEMTKCVL